MAPARAQLPRIRPLNTQIVPAWQGLEWQLPSGPEFHNLPLRYDPGLRVPDLLVDGQHRIGGYPGHSQFQEESGVMFGATLYRSEQAMGGAIRHPSLTNRQRALE